MNKVNGVSSKMVKIKEGFVMRQVAGQAIVIAIGKASEKFHGMINLNESGSCVWKGIEEGLDVEKIADRIVQEFEVDYWTALKDTQEMMDKMKEQGILED